MINFPRSIVTKAGLAVASFGGLVVLCACVLSFSVAKEQIRSAMFGEMDNRSGLIATHIKTSIDNIADNLSGMASNKLMANALADNTGRDNYLLPYLKSLYKIGGATIQIQLCDYRGRPIATNLVQREWEQAAELGRAVVESNSPKVDLLEKGGSLWATIAWPVLYSNTGLPEGAVLYRFELNEVLRNIFPRAAEDESFRVSFSKGDGKETISLVQGKSPPDEVLSMHRTLDLPAVFNPWVVNLEVWTDKANYTKELWRLIYGFAVIAFLSLTVLIPAGLFVSRWLLNRLRELETVALKVMETGSLEQTFPETGDDEVASLGRVFNIMLRDLDLAQQNLRREADTEIMRHSERLKRVLAQTTEGYLRVDVARRVVVEVNDAFCLIAGRSCSLWEEQPVPSFMEEFLARAERTDISTAWRGEELLIKTPEDQEHYFLAQINLDIDKEGNKQLVAFLTDITFRKQAETALRESEEKFRVMSESSYDALIMIDAEDIIHFWSSAAERMFLYSSEEALGQKMHELITPSECQPEAYQNLQPFASTAKGNTIGVVEECVALRKDGTTFPVERSLASFQKGGEWFAVGVLRDITARKEMDRLKKEFISTVSHELRTPLTSIKGSLSLLLGGTAGEFSRQANQLLSIADNNTTRLINLINDILDMEKIDSGKMVYHMERLDLSEAVRASIHDNQALASHYGVMFKSSIPETAFPVAADRIRLAQVLANLLSNAAKYSPKGDTVEIDLEQRGDAVRVSVRDHGPGVPESFRSRIFQKFAQADSSDTRQRGGTGLGLSITQSIIKSFNGHIDFESKEGNGAVFFFELPLLANEDDN